VTHCSFDVRHAADTIVQRRHDLRVTIPAALGALEFDRPLRLFVEMYWHDLEQKRPVPLGCIPNIARALGLSTDDIVKDRPTFPAAVT